MVGISWLVVSGVVVCVAAVALGVIALVWRRSLMAAAGVLIAVGAFWLVTSWLLASPGTSRVDAIKTGGLGGGAVLAVYATWLNDRRRRVEEGRHEVERARAELDRERVADDRFAQAVALLGHDADQVRLGGLHVLAGLARTRPDYTQTVLDVLCAYLRRPFAHPHYQAEPSDPNTARITPDETWTAERIDEVDREREVRNTAQRLITDLLPGTGDPAASGYDIDLTGARLEFVNLYGRRLRQLIARRTQFYGITRLSRVLVEGEALFTDAVFHGRCDLGGARFAGGLALIGARIDGLWHMSEASVSKFADLRTPAPCDQTGTLLLQAPSERVKLPADSDWSVSRPAES